MRNFFVIISLLSLFVTQGQIEKEKVVFSEKRNLLLDINLFETEYWLNDCEIEKIHILDINDSISGLLKMKDTVYFEFVKGRDKKILDSIFCINSEIQYKNKDTSLYPSYISDKINLKKFYKKYGFNQIGRLINNEIEFEINNIRDTIVTSSISTDIYKNPNLKVKSKIFNLSLIHKGKTLKKLKLPFSVYNLNTETTEKDVTDNFLDFKNLETKFDEFLEQLNTELSSYKTNPNAINETIKMNVYNYNNKYYIKFRYRESIYSSLELFHKDSKEAREIEISGDFSEMIQISTHYFKDDYFDDFLILD